MPISIDEVKKLAVLSRLKLTPEEEKRHAETITAVLDYMKILNEVDTEGVKPVTGGTDLINVTRADTVEASTDEATEDLLKAAPTREGNFVKTKGVFE